MDEVSFVETFSVLDKTDIFMNVSIGGADGGGEEQMRTSDTRLSCCRDIGLFKTVQPDFPPAETPGIGHDPITF